MAVAVRGFNEAGAASPRKYHDIAVRGAVVLEASMRPGQLRPGNKGDQATNLHADTDRLQ